MDDFAAAQQEKPFIDEAYGLGYEDGRHVTEEHRIAEVCHNCHGVGFSAG